MSFKINSSAEEKFIASKEAALLCGYTIDHISRLCRQEKLNALREPNGRWHATKESLIAYQENARRLKFERYDYESFWSRIIHGEGWIQMFAEKKRNSA